MRAPQRAVKLGAVKLAWLCASLALLGWLWWAARRPPDLIVYGATPQGVALAVSAARAGLRVTLLDAAPQPGGVLTRGWLATLDVSLDRRGRPQHGSFFGGLWRGAGHNVTLDLPGVRRALWAPLFASGVRVRLSTPLAGVRVQNGRVLSVTPQGAPPLRARFFADASDTADLAALCGAPFTLGRQDGGQDSAQMAATLVFRLRGADWAALGRRVLAERRAGLLAHWGGNGAVGLGGLTARYRPSDPHLYALRGLNLARQRDGTLLVSGLQLFGVDGTRPEARRAARARAALEAARVWAFLRREAPDAFGASTLAGVAPELYVRESRHLIGLARLHADDVLGGRRFADALAVGRYPLDGQVYREGEAPFFLGLPRPYEVPLRALVPRNLKNLLVVSQAASFDSAASYSARVAPLQVNLGQSAGLAVAVAARFGEDFSQLTRDDHALHALHALRALLRRRGALENLPPAPPSRFAPAEVALLRRALFGGPFGAPGLPGADAPMPARNFFNHLEHVGEASGLAGIRPRVLAWRAQLASAPGATLSHADARRVLLSLGATDLPPDSAEPLAYGEAARVLWAWLSESQTRRRQWAGQ